MNRTPQPAPSLSGSVKDGQARAGSTQPPAPQQQQQQQQQLVSSAAQPGGTNAGHANSPPELLSDLDPDNVSRELKKEGSDWFAVWSSQSKKMLDVGLVHTLNHETYVASAVLVLCLSCL
jgi:hypothetical protein